MLRIKEQETRLFLREHDDDDDDDDDDVDALFYFFKRCIAQTVYTVCTMINYKIFPCIQSE